MRSSFLSLKSCFFVFRSVRLFKVFSFILILILIIHFSHLSLEFFLQKKTKKELVWLYFIIVVVVSLQREREILDVLRFPYIRTQQIKVMVLCPVYLIVVTSFLFIVCMYIIVCMCFSSFLPPYLGRSARRARFWFVWLGGGHRPALPSLLTYLLSRQSGSLSVSFFHSSSFLSFVWFLSSIGRGGCKQRSNLLLLPLGKRESEGL